MFQGEKNPYLWLDSQRYPAFKKSGFRKGWLRTTKGHVNQLFTCCFLHSPLTDLILSFPTKLSGNSADSTFKICHKFILSSPSPLLPSWFMPSCLPGILLLPSSLQSMLNTKASLVLLKNKADYVTPLHTMHQTRPCSRRIIPKALFYSRRISALCPPPLLLLRAWLWCVPSCSLLFSLMASCSPS